MAYPYDPYGQPQQSGFGGLLGRTFSSPAFQLGASLLATSGPSLTPKSPAADIGKALLQTQLMQQNQQEQAYENEVRRAKIAAAQQELEQKKALTDFMASPDFEPPPGMSRQTAGMLAVTAPAEFAKAYVTSPQDELARQQLLDAKAKAKEDFSQKERNVASTFAAGSQMADALTALEGTPLEPGVPGVKIARDAASVLTNAADVFGIEGPWKDKLKTNVVDFDTLNKLSAGFMQKLVQDLPGTRVGANTMSLVGQATTGVGISSGANRRIIISTIKDKMQEAIDLGYKVDTAGAQKLIDVLEKSTAGGEPTPPESAVPQIGHARELDRGGPPAQEAPAAPAPPLGPPGEGPGTNDLPLRPVSGSMPGQPGGGYEKVLNQYGELQNPNDPSATAAPFNDSNPAYVMGGPGIATTFSDLFGKTGIPAGISAATPYVSEAAAPIIQQGAKTAAKAIIAGKDVLSLAGRKIGDLDISGKIVTLKNASDKALVSTQDYLRQLSEAGVTTVVIGGRRFSIGGE